MDFYKAFSLFVLARESTHTYTHIHIYTTHTQTLQATTCTTEKGSKEEVGEKGGRGGGKGKGKH